ncbi:MAG: hypothetical protein ACOX9A_02910 [Anaerolineae bacterium]
MFDRSTRELVDPEEDRSAGEAPRRGGGPPFDVPPDDGERLLAGFCYASQAIVPGLLPMVLLLTDQTRHSRYLRDHAAQSLGLLVAGILYYLAATIAFIVLSAIVPCLGCVLWLIFSPPMIAFFYYGYQAYMVRPVEIPWLSQFMRRNGWL